MLRYRCATLFGRLYAPEVLMGMATVEEAIDITPEPTVGAAPAATGSRADALASRLKGGNGGGTGTTVVDEPKKETPPVVTAEKLAEKPVEKPATNAPQTDSVDELFA